MVLENANNGESNQSSETELRSPSNGETFGADQTQRFTEEIDSTCSTPYVSAPSSPGRGPNGYFYSAPASPMHFVLSSAPASSSASAFISASTDLSVSGSFEFEFSARFPSNASTTAGSMISADELFLNGQIRPMKLSSHLQRPQILSPLLDLEVEDEDEEGKVSRETEFEKREESLTRGRDLRLRSGSLHRRARSLSPLRNTPFQWHEEEEYQEVRHAGELHPLDLEDSENKQAETPSTGTTPSVSASSSRSSSSGRSSKRWVFLKDFLYRSKSEGRGNSKEKFWSSISFSPAKEKKSSSTSLPFSSSKEKKSSAAPTTAEAQKPKRSQQVSAKKTAAGKPANGVGKRRIPPSAHELHYTANRAQAEEMRKKTFLPYRQGLLGCLGFSSKSYGAMNGFARTLNAVSSR
ncbi:PREDICTED: uncharacterized protein LOC104605121 [Nelumbo nucifera]|uniref:Uncharacterized protein LOC104605121 n=1 Tax=Nelumbo nucifera TaxID=4432 RepID=A0A1U8AL46_NELNU|nr:PREDICTED: uncharacterized protein LOC104605121 [Nelumbo nucifera]